MTFATLLLLLLSSLLLIPPLLLHQSKMKSCLTTFAALLLLLLLGQQPHTTTTYAFCPCTKIRSADMSTTSTTRMRSTVVVDEPVTIEKTTTTTTKETTSDEKAAHAGTKLPAFLLRLWNDPYNKREFVARCLAEVCGKSDTESFQIMMHAHQSGMGVIGQYDFEIAELYLQSLKERNLLVDMIPVEGEFYVMFCLFY